MRKIMAQPHGFTERSVMRVLALDELISSWAPQLKFLVPVNNETEYRELRQLQAVGLHNIYPILSSALWKNSPSVTAILGDASSFETGDVVVPSLVRQEIQVLYRSSDVHHAIFLTNRCNSLCLMCSQPPTRPNDAWLIDEAISVIRHISPSPQILGMTGGEPLLLGTRLREVLDAAFDQHPTTRIDLLTNGRLLGDSQLAEKLLTGLQDNVSWLIPLYGHSDFLHDFVVQSPGAFHETLAGVLNLQAYGQAVQIRIVLIEPVLNILPQLCAFIGRNLPFVREVALMGCEPIGFALANRDQCEVDLTKWHPTMIQGVKALDRADIPCVLMNIPLCALPQSLWRYAHRSISDWKRVFIDECKHCTVKNECCGLFAWHEQGWLPGPIIPVQEANSR